MDTFCVYCGKKTGTFVPNYKAEKLGIVFFSACKRIDCTEVLLRKDKKLVAEGCILVDRKDGEQYSANANAKGFVGMARSGYDKVRAAKRKLEKAIKGDVDGKGEGQDKKDDG